MLTNVCAQVWLDSHVVNPLQVQAIREGLISVIPDSVLSLLTWSNLERGVCGDREISVAQLKSACKCFYLVAIDKLLDLPETH